MITTHDIATVEEEELSDGSLMYNIRIMSTSPLTSTIHSTELTMPSYEKAHELADMINDNVLDIETW